MELVRSPDTSPTGSYATVERRYSVSLRGSLTMARGGRPTVVRIVNISEGGLMAVVQGHDAVSGQVDIAVRHIDDLSGTVVWARGGMIGVKFDEAIDPVALIAERAERELVAARITDRLMRNSSGLFAVDEADDDIAPFEALMNTRRSGLDSAH